MREEGSLGGIGGEILPKKLIVCKWLSKNPSEAKPTV